MVTSASTSELLNTLRDSIGSEVTDIAVGTGTGNPTKNDTSLESEVISKAVSDTVKTDQEVTHVMRLLSGEANGNDITEAGDKDSAGNLDARWVFSAISKTSDIEVEIRTTKRVSNP